MTDPHLFADRSGKLRGTATFASLERVLRHYARSGWSADVVALTGDLTQDEDRDAYANIETLFAPLALPILTVPGNHDVRSQMRAALGAAPFHYCGSLSFGNWLLVGIDSCVDGVAHGEVGADELARLGALIDGSDAQHVLLCLHHPPARVGSRWLDGVGLRGRDEFLDAVHALGRIRGILAGHVHQRIETTDRGIDIIATPSTCRQFKPDSDEFAVDDKPPAYRQIELQSDGRIESKLVWVEADA